MERLMNDFSIYVDRQPVVCGGMLYKNYYDRSGTDKCFEFDVETRWWNESSAMKLPEARDQAASKKGKCGIIKGTLLVNPVNTHRLL